jgi:V/A-type H+/Na+-transporting ATPase subunit E
VGLEGLLDSLTQTARREAEERRAAARAEADRVLAEAGEQVKQRLATGVARREAVLRRDLERAVAAERQARRDAELKARAATLDQILALVRARLPEILAREDYRRGLPGELEQALYFLGQRPAVLHTPPALRSLMTSLLKGRAGLRVEADPACTTGPVLTSDDGSLTIDLSFETRLAARWGRLSQVIARELSPPA